MSISASRQMAASKDWGSNSSWRASIRRVCTFVRPSLRAASSR
jgi:hypothetical protein